MSTRNLQGCAIPPNKVLWDMENQSACQEVPENGVDGWALLMRPYSLGIKCSFT